MKPLRVTALLAFLLFFANNLFAAATLMRMRAELAEAKIEARMRRMSA